MTFLYSSAEQNAAMDAAVSADDGQKRLAYLESWQDSIGADAKVVLYREASAVWTATVSGALPIVGTAIFITAVSQVSVSAADIDTGDWEVRVEKAADDTVYFGATVSKDGDTNEFALSDDLGSDDDITVSLTFHAPDLDSNGGGGEPLALTLSIMKGDVNESLLHEMYLHGVPPDWRWGSHANYHLGPNPPQRDGWGNPAFVPWGVCGTERNNPPGSHNWRYAVHAVYTAERRNGQWSMVQAVTSPSNIAGALYTNYETNANTSADSRTSNGFYEVKFPDTGGSLHFFTYRFAIPPTGAQHRAVLIKSSVTMDNPGGTDDRAAARLAILASGDYWKTPSIAWSNTEYVNDGFVTGRARKPALYPEMSWHVSHTMTSDADINGFLAWLESQGVI